MTWSERLSGLDAMFLYIEDRTAHMHVGAVAVFEGRPPSYPDLLLHLASRLDRAPRYRQRLAFVPLELGRPVWVDDAAFDLEYHLRHTALPPPGTEGQLEKLAGRVFAQRLDRDRPLWELWLVEGLGPDRFALISKAHHCMLDGVAGADLASALLGTDPTLTAPAAAAPWSPRPAPAGPALAAAALGEQLLHPWRAVREATRPASPARRRLREFATGVRPLLRLSTLGRAPASSLNRPLGPHRRWEMAALELEAVKAVKAALGGTVNDVLLAVVAGALRAQLLARGETLPATVRVMVPVSVRAEGGAGELGNQVTAVFCELPVGEAEPRRRLELVSREMSSLKRSGQAVGALAWTRLGDFVPPPVLAQVARFQSSFRYMNLVVTNIPGPREPLYLLGRRMREWYPLVPLAPGQSLGIAIQSYHGTVGFGLLGDAGTWKDLAALARAIPAALAELQGLARPAAAGGSD